MKPIVCGHDHQTDNTDNTVFTVTDKNRGHRGDEIEKERERERERERESERARERAP